MRGSPPSTPPSSNCEKTKRRAVVDLNWNAIVMGQGWGCVVVGVCVWPSMTHAAQQRSKKRERGEGEEEKRGRKTLRPAKSKNTENGKKNERASQCIVSIW